MSTRPGGQVIDGLSDARLASRPTSRAEMIDRLRSTSEAMRAFARPALLLAIVAFAYAVFVVFTSTSREGDRFLFPSLLVFAWALSLYGFIETFRDVPQRVGSDAAFFTRLRRRLARLWYWLIGLLFVGTTIAVAVVTLRVLLVWYGDYAAA